MWLSYALLAFATRPKEKPHDEIPPVRMTYTGGTGGDDHGHDLLPYVQNPTGGGVCDPMWYRDSCDSGCGSCVQTSSCDGGCNGGCNDGSGRRRLLGLGSSKRGGTSCDASCDKSCDHLSCDQTSHLTSGDYTQPYTHQTSCDATGCEISCDEQPFLNTQSGVLTQSCDEQCAYVDACDHEADCDESSCDDSSSTGGSAIHSCDFTDGGQSCDFGCEHIIAGDYHSGTEGANNECDGDECEPVVDCGFLNCGR